MPRTAPVHAGLVAFASADPLDDETGADAVAHYPASEGITSTQILALVREHRDELADVLEPLPARLRAGERLPDRAAALTAVHFPDAEGDAPGGRRRLAFDELLLLQLALLRRRAVRETAAAAPALDGAMELTERWLAHA